MTYEPHPLTARGSDQPPAYGSPPGAHGSVQAGTYAVGPDTVGWCAMGPYAVGPRRGAEEPGPGGDGYFPAPTGSTETAGPDWLAGMLMAWAMVCAWVSLGGVTTRLVNVTPEPPVLFGG